MPADPPQPLSAEQVAAVKEAALEFLPKQSGQLLDLRTVARVCDTAESLRAALSAATRENEKVFEQLQSTRGSRDHLLSVVDAVNRIVKKSNHGQTAAAVAELRDQLSAATRERDEMKITLSAWHSAFGSTQLTHATAKLAAATEARRAAEEAKNDAYAQRNRLAILLAAEHGGTVVPAVPSEPGWTSVLLIPTTAGQISFHLHDSELPAVLSCPSIRQGDGEWDGHDDAEKWRRVETSSRRARKSADASTGGNDA